jgi:hypothetical protein
VAATSHGKLYGLDSISGKVLWQNFFAGKTFQKLPESLYLFVQRTAHHYGFEARYLRTYYDHYLSMGSISLVRQAFCNQGTHASKVIKVSSKFCEMNNSRLVLFGLNI